MVPTSVSDMLSFHLVKASSEQFAPRLGRLVAKNGTISTPHYIANTSRGLVPHISPDSMVKHTQLHGVYLAFEDFVEKYPKSKPLVMMAQGSNDDGRSLLRDFTAMPQEQLLILGARRCPPVECPMENTNTAVAICTSVGFTLFDSADFATAASILRPDIVIGLGDLAVKDNPGSRRRSKMSGRSEVWMREIAVLRHGRSEVRKNMPAVFAPILPICLEEQSLYVEMLSDDLLESLSGLALYDATYDVILPASLIKLPRLSLAPLSTPGQVLQNVANGIDLFVVPFIGDNTDAGIAMDFTFPPSDHAKSSAKAALGVDMWDSRHAQDLSPLNTDCSCYACMKHHRAYLNHLLSAREMLAWVLLQLHNLYCMDAFFAGVRSSIELGTFEADMERFNSYYESEFPVKTGEGPRIRGYQFKSEGPNEPKKNVSMYKMMSSGKDEKAGASLPNPSTDAQKIEEKGFAEAL